MTLPTSTSDILIDASDLNGQAKAFAAVLGLLAETDPADVLADPCLTVLFNKVNDLYDVASNGATAKLAEVL